MNRHYVKQSTLTMSCSPSESLHLTPCLTFTIRANICHALPTEAREEGYKEIVSSLQMMMAHGVHVDSSINLLVSDAKTCFLHMVMHV